MGFINKKSANQAGVVSIITVSLLAIILTLITTAFVKSMISNQRQTLDSQLSSQAFYAAETGINDVMTVLKNNIDVSAALDSSDCSLFMNVIKASNLFGETNDPTVLNQDSNIKYTCVLVDSKPQNIILTNPEVDHGLLFPIKEGGGSVVEKLQITWGNSGQTIPSGLATELLPKTEWGTDSVALIRLAIYYPTGFNRTSLINNQKTFFLRPVQATESDGISILNASTTSGNMPFGVNCTEDNLCTVNITNLDTLAGTLLSGGPNLNVYVRITPIYSSSDITLTAYNGSFETTPLELADAQYSIDVTGRANDVYRRIEVRRSIMPDYDFPDYVVSSGNTSGATGDLCKQFITWPIADPTAIEYDDVSGCSF